MRAFKALLVVLCAVAILVACNSRAPEDLGVTAEAISGLSNGQPCSSALQCGSGHCVDAVCCADDCHGGVRDDWTCSNVYGDVMPKSQQGTCTQLAVGQPCGVIQTLTPSCTWRGGVVNGGHNCNAPPVDLLHACYNCGAGCVPDPNFNDCNCGGGFPVCQGNTCGQCVTSADCPTTAPVCNQGACYPCDPANGLFCPNNKVCDSGQCYPCSDTNPGQCAGTSTPFCSNHTCVACLTSANCQNTPTTPICNAAHTCVACQTVPSPDAACAAVNGATPYCDTVQNSGRCEPCDNDTTQKCAGGPPPYCNTSTATHACVECNIDAQCTTAPKLFCINHACAAQCTPAGLNANCQAIDPTKPYCDNSGFCQQCRTDADCGKNGAPAGLACVNNLCEPCHPGSADCNQTSTTPVCNATGNCVACATDNGAGGLQCPTVARPACTSLVAGNGSCVECTAEKACPVGQLCDLNRNVCVACLTNADCPSLTAPICNTAVGTCVGCDGDHNQAGANFPCPTTDNPACILGTGQCVQCSNTNVTACPAGLPACANNVCVECTSDAQCTSGPNGKCNLGTHTCVPGCSSNANCVAPTPVCDVPTSTCVQCEVSGDCAPGQTCTAAHTCVACTDNSQCPAATPICTGGSCVPCQNDKGSGGANACFDATKPACVKSGVDQGKCVPCTGTDLVLCVPPTPACNDTTHQCVECKTNAQCTTANKPICDANGTCVACTADFGNVSPTACPTAALPACTGGACVECDGSNITACTVAKPVCNLTTDKCVECNVNADCKGANGVCNTITHTCTQGCTNDSNCSAPASVCKLPDGFCVPCTPEKPGACTGATPVCDPTTDTCVGCVTGKDCTGATPVCDPTTKTCTATCTASAQCPTDKPVCNPTTHTCTQCAQSSDCPPSAPICDPTTGTCGTTCTASAQCPGDKPICNPTSHQCVQCTDNTNCPQSAPICDPSTGTCTTNCTTSSQCPGDKPVCDPASKQCVQCQDDANCPSTAPHCDGTTHTCVASNQVPFSLEGGGCSCTTAGGGDGSSAVPALIGVGLAVSAFSRRRRERRQAQQAR